MTSIVARAGLLVVAATLGACSAASDDGSASANAFGEKITDAEFATSMPNAAAMQPYNSIIDTTLSGPPCVETTGAAPVASKPVPHAEVSLQQVGSRTALATAMGLDVSVKGGAATGPNFEAGLQLLRQYDTSKNTLSFLLKSTKEINQTSVGTYRLTAANQELLRTDPHRFIKQCGRGFITGTTRSATLYALVEVHVENEQSASGLAAKVGGGKSVGSLGNVSASIAANIAKLRDELGLKVSVHVQMDGFSTALRIPVLDMAQPTPVTTVAPDAAAQPTVKLPPTSASAAATTQAINAFSQLLQEMLTAAQTAQQDAIDDKATTQPRLTKVSVAAYRTLATTTADDEPRFAAIDRTLKNAQDSLQEILEVRQQMANVVEFEVDPFLRAAVEAAQGSGFLAYNLRAMSAGTNDVEPLAFRVAPEQLREIGKSWHHEFTSEARDTTRSVVDALADDCITSIQNGDFQGEDFKGCLRVNAKAPLDNARSRLTRYARSGRILPVMFSSGGTAFFVNSKKQCTAGWHVPQYRTEAVALSMVIPPNAMSDAPSIAMWVDDPQTICSSSEGSLMSVVRSSGAIPVVNEKCSTFLEGWRLPVLCVPSSGPFGLVSDRPGDSADKF